MKGNGKPSKPIIPHYPETDVEADGLPEGWESSLLMDMCQLIRGVSYKKGEEIKSAAIGYLPILRANNIANGLVFDDLYYVPSNRISDEQALRIGDVVLAMSSGSKAIVGKAASVDRHWSGAFGAFCGVLRPSALTDWRLFGYFFQTSSYRNTISELAAGVNINNLKREYFEGLRLPLPPLAEQQRIVEKVEQLLEQVNAARDRLSKIPAILKAFRQSVLSAACSGRLTADWREENPDVGNPPGHSAVPQTDHGTELPATWGRRAVGEFFLDARYGTSAKCGRGEDGVPVLRIPNISEGFLRLKDLKYAELAEQEVRRLALRQGDLVVCRTNGSLDLIGKAAVVPHFVKPHAFASYLIRQRLDQTALVPEFLHVCLTSRIGRDHIEERARTTAGQYNLNLEILRSLVFPLAPLEEQHEIVCRVEALFKLADAIEKRVAAATLRAEKLTQAILAKAFRGELVPTEAELARKEGRDYEPASVLLERIRKERAEKTPARKKG